MTQQLTNVQLQNDILFIKNNKPILRVPTANTFDKITRSKLNIDKIDKKSEINCIIAYRNTVLEFVKFVLVKLIDKFMFIMNKL